MTKKSEFVPDTMENLKGSDLIQLSRKLLTAVVDSTNMLEVQEMTQNKLKEAKVVMGFLNAADRAMKTKMSYFKMAGVKDKVEAIKKNGKRL